jgi:hypothetical protein
MVLFTGLIISPINRIVYRIFIARSIPRPKLSRAEKRLPSTYRLNIRCVNGVKYYDWNTLEEIAESTVEGWMNSPGHRKNILIPVWQREGIGVSIAPDDKVYITENFC